METTTPETPEETTRPSEGNQEGGETGEEAGEKAGKEAGGKTGEDEGIGIKPVSIPASTIISTTKSPEEEEGDVAPQAGAETGPEGPEPAPAPEEVPALEFEAPVVEINPIAYIKICLHALQYPQADSEGPQKYQRVFGFLLGNLFPDKIRVNDYIPLAHHPGQIPAFEEDPFIFNHVAEINREEIEEYNSDNCVVGWFQSKGGKGVEFWPVDVQNHLYFQRDFQPGSIAMVFDPTRLEEDYGFEVYQFTEDTATISEFSQPESLAWEFGKVEDNEGIFFLVNQICAKFNEKNTEIVTEWTPEEEVA